MYWPSDVHKFEEEMVGHLKSGKIAYVEDVAEGLEKEPAALTGLATLASNSSPLPRSDVAHKFNLVWCVLSPLQRLNGKLF